MKVSVIIPAFNEEGVIEDCLRSLLSQSYKDLEIILVDDGSTDKTKQLISKFPVKLLTQTHKGPALARNKGASYAKGEILVFIDADVTFDQNFISDLVAPIINGEYIGTFSKNEYVANLENIWSRCWSLNQNLTNKKMIPDDYPAEGMDFRAILKDQFLKVKGFDDTGYTDTWTLAEKLGVKPHVAERAKYYHANPDSLKEVFIQSKWVAKRKYKYGFFGLIIALIRASLPISILLGFYKAIKYKEVRFIIFKIIYDLAVLIGIFEMLIFKKLSK